MEIQLKIEFFLTFLSGMSTAAIPQHSLPHPPIMGFILVTSQLFGLTHFKISWFWILVKCLFLYALTPSIFDPADCYLVVKLSTYHALLLCFASLLLAGIEKVTPKDEINFRFFCGKIWHGPLSSTSSHRSQSSIQAHQHHRRSRIGGAWCGSIIELKPPLPPAPPLPSSLRG